MIQSMEERRTIRKYTHQVVASDMVNNLLRVAFRASTKGALQLYSVIVTRDAAMKEKLSPAQFNQPTIKTAPVVSTFCADFIRFSQQ